MATPRHLNAILLHGKKSAQMRCPRVLYWVTGCRHDDARSLCLLEAEAVSINLAGHERGVLALRLHYHLVCVG